MKLKKRLQLYFGLAFWGLLIFSMSFMIMPFSVNARENGRIVLVLVSALFWVSLLTGLIFLILTKRTNQRIKKKRKRKRIGWRGKSFVCQNIPVAIADTCFIGSIAGFVILLITHRSSDYVTYVDCSVLCFSLSMHFLFEDSLYRYLWMTNKKDKEK